MEHVMSKKITSTILLFAVFIGFLWWGISMITTTLSAPNKDGESIIYGLLLLGCAGYALFSLLLLPRRKQP
jgi:TRAP-type C4-dicarboxylate transport system permease small subunit